MFEAAPVEPGAASASEDEDVWCGASPIHGVAMHDSDDDVSGFAPRVEAHEPQRGVAHSVWISSVTDRVDAVDALRQHLLPAEQVAPAFLPADPSRQLDIFVQLEDAGGVNAGVPEVVAPGEGPANVLVHVESFLALDAALLSVVLSGNIVDSGTVVLDGATHVISCCVLRDSFSQRSNLA